MEGVENVDTSDMEVGIESVEVRDVGYKYIVAREKRSNKKKDSKEEDAYKILDEIAKLRGFKGRKKVEKLGDKFKIIDISPKGEWAEYHAKKLGFKGTRKGDNIDGEIAEEELTPLEEFKDYMKKKTGSPPDNVYAALIPQDEISSGLEILKQKWLSIHQKFIGFCVELGKDLDIYFEKNKKMSAAITIEDMFRGLEEYHSNHTGSMNIYSRDELVIGLSYCMPEKGIRTKMAANKRVITFEKISDNNMWTDRHR